MQTQYIYKHAMHQPCRYDVSCGSSTYALFRVALAFLGTKMLENRLKYFLHCFQPVVSAVFTSASPVIPVMVALTRIPSETQDRALVLRTVVSVVFIISYLQVNVDDHLRLLHIRYDMRFQVSPQIFQHRLACDFLTLL